ncbi:MAG: ketoacyl-ACP synthase III [Rhizobiales bacterium]|nr:ketoacyl-ACP synthase III [Hyphomicrobiales bacterium]MBO6698279.1 ketoacyl-ACP synthase III [Hyphomicrobiales bacterium]MBO6735467.1 ketoacyl-ACP synthase III [Hyphomicrobiales bacterium]MBO6910725.1 ketoacyl-ACP synthase III [Hyphomicrobiales bacterium]MBO6956914.1 ketoacyl-ACP synthase III [Hyphomicrobiales bacterium]
MTSAASSVRHARVLGVGSYLPAKVLTNDDLAKMVDTSDEWIVQRTGIQSRHIAASDERTSDLAFEAAKAALANADVDPQSIDLIVLATATPDYTFPATATQVQQKLGIRHGYAFDMQAVCSGFVFAMATADSQLKAGLANRALVIGAETFSRIIDWEDRTTCVLFADGAGAVVLDAVDGPVDPEGPGIIASSLRSDGNHREKLFVDGGPSTNQMAGHLRMQGKEVFKHAVGMITDVIVDVFEQTGFNGDTIDWFVPHQANKRIIDASANKLKIDPAKVVVTVDHHGNTSAASIPLALSEAVADGRIKKGDVVLLEAMGGGFTWGACLLRM